MAKIHVIIPAAGSGSRMQQHIPKQFATIGDKTILEYVESIFSHISVIESISIAVSSSEKYIDNISHKFSKKTQVLISGGASRSETVLNTINLLDVSLDDWILVHDAARVGLTEFCINEFIKYFSNDKVGGIMAIQVPDTVKRVNKNNEILNTEERDELWLAQTPQMFRFNILKKALLNYDGLPTDESQAIEALGLKPKVFKGNPLNFKITFAEDIVRAEKSLEILGKNNG
ncbi:MAG: 2-C-methyl-D-erythritol 4-phosphate cytidylyltransferase [Methylophilaceae bacterium]|nr:2-C-methyl-D-erythritol 4-phosphate cytidylyltransferase [Methylophilaceae bacterium]MBL6726795.1 2-C-methyl-D-erythritol 4-phosphate cytidylyltransferase [Methylophilaceae bacterium]MBL6728880.1 2-C-methyl-D-erythritol 4-phosphate cytidylyltransferase [Methylophilaceae bacterium]MBL6791308.1 2-C-methyl-D-erythritol 4-phosphate cytidylyltransferase [Methylophilaceae bacterium]